MNIDTFHSNESGNPESDPPYLKPASLAEDDEVVILFNQMLRCLPEEVRKRNRELSWPEKVAKSIEYQNLLTPLLRARGYDVRILGEEK